MNHFYKWTIGKIKSEYRSMTEVMCTGEREFSKWLDGLLIAEGETLPGHEKHVALVRRCAERYIVVELSTVYGFMSGALKGAERTTIYDGYTIEEATKKLHASRRQKGQGDLLEGLKPVIEGWETMKALQVNQCAAMDEIKRRLPRPDTPRPHDREVSQLEAAQILTDEGYRISPRQVQNWERYIKTNGAKGTCPPEGYRIELRAEYLTFKAWAKIAARGKRMKTAQRQQRQRMHKTNA